VRTPVAERGAGLEAKFPVQAKLRVGAVDDPLEREADDLADHIMGLPDLGASLLQRCPGGCPGDEELRRCAVRRWADGGSGKPTVAAPVDQAIDRHRGGGSPLTRSARRFFERRFGASFDTVRVHTDAEASRLAAAVSARAFTVGRDIFFGDGQFRPEAPDGRRLLAHELTHTIQQAHRQQVQRQLEAEPAQPPDAGLLYQTYQDDLVALGKELYRLVSESPANTGLVLQVLDEVPWESRDNVAYWFVQPLSDNQLLQVAAGEHGRDLLGRLRTELGGGASWPSEQQEIGRIDRALAEAAPGPALALPSLGPGVPPFPFDLDPATDIEGQFTIERYLDLQTAWSWVESDPGTTDQLLASLQRRVESVRPLIACVSPPGDDSAVEELDELAAELGYAVERLTGEDDRGFEAMREHFEWIAGELLDLDPVFEGVERTGSVGSCVTVVLLPFAEGLIEGLTAIDPAQGRLFSSRITNNPYFGAGFTLGAQAGILIDAKDVVFDAVAFARHPVATTQEAMEAFADLVDELFGPEGAEAARGIGRGAAGQLGAKIAKLNKVPGPFRFAFDLGMEVGPAIVYTVLSFLGFEGFVAGRLVFLADEGLKRLKSFQRLSTLFRRAPDAEAPPQAGPPEAGPAPAPAGREAAPEAPPTLEEIIRDDGVVLSSGHRILLIGEQLARCSACAILKVVYRPVLEHPELAPAVRTALVDRIDDLQRQFDGWRSEGLTRDEALRELDGQLKKLDDEITGLADRFKVTIGFEPGPELAELAELLEQTLPNRPDAIGFLIESFPNRPEAIRLLLQQENAAALVTALVSPRFGEGARREFAMVWRARSENAAIRNAIIRVLESPAPSSRLEAALRQLRTVDVRDANAIDEIVTPLGQPAIRTVPLVPNRPWRNQNPDFLTPEEFAALPETGTIPPNRVRFAQRSASPVFDDGRPVQETIDQLSDPAFNPAAIEEIEICLHEDRVYTLSTRRVIAAQAAALVRPDLEISYRKKTRLTPTDLGKLQQVDGVSIDISGAMAP
jgi:Domain of unknown function (DUF4157)